MNNAITDINRTPDSASGLTVVEEWLHRKYLTEEEIRTPLANSSYGSRFNLPKMAGQYAKFTRRNKGRLPEKGSEGTDPESGLPLGYTQLRAPIEWIKEWSPLTMEASATSWLELAKDIREVMNEALRRQLHALVQDALYVGRYKPGKRNSSGATTGTTPYFHFRTTLEATVSMYGQSFTFLKGARSFVGGKSAFNQLDASDRHTMEDYIRAKTKLHNGHVPRINGGVVAVITEAIQEDLMRDDRYFATAIRDQEARKKLFSGHLVSYRGIHWVIQDDPFTLSLGGNVDVYTVGGNVHVAHVFGMDAFAYLRLGGENAGTPVFKVQDISKTGSLTTTGYTLPFQALTLKTEWLANVVGPVSNPDSF